MLCRTSPDALIPLTGLLPLVLGTMMGAGTARVETGTGVGTVLAAGLVPTPTMASGTTFFPERYAWYRSSYIRGQLRPIPTLPSVSSPSFSPQHTLSERKTLTSKLKWQNSFCKEILS